MKTTFDLPDELLQRARITAAQRKTTLKKLVVQGLEYATTHSLPDPEFAREKCARKLIAALSLGRNAEPVGRLNREEIYDRHNGKWE